MNTERTSLSAEVKLNNKNTQVLQLNTWDMRFIHLTALLINSVVRSIHNDFEWDISGE